MSSGKFEYKSGYKHQLAGDYLHLFHKRFPIRTDGLPWLIKADPPGGQGLLLRRGYAWDGATWVPDFLTVIRASAIHDALYQCMRLGLLDRSYRKQADREFYLTCRGAGMNWAMARLFYIGVRWFAGGAARAENKNPVKTAP